MKLQLILKSRLVERKAKNLERKECNETKKKKKVNKDHK